MTDHLRIDWQDGTTHEIEMTTGQLLDVNAGKPVAYFPRDERILIDEDGTITRHESAIPQQPDEAA